MADPTVLAFRCPVCSIGFELYLRDLTDEQAQTIEARCGNNHGRQVTMERLGPVVVENLP